MNKVGERVMEHEMEIVAFFNRLEEMTIGLLKFLTVGMISFFILKEYIPHVSMVNPLLFSVSVSCLMIPLLWLYQKMERRVFKLILKR